MNFSVPHINLTCRMTSAGRRGGLRFCPGVLGWTGTDCSYLLTENHKGTFIKQGTFHSHSGKRNVKFLQKRRSLRQDVKKT